MSGPSNTRGEDPLESKSIAYSNTVTAKDTWTLPEAGATFVDRHLADAAVSCSWAQIARLVAEATARFDPERAEEQRRRRADYRRFDIDLTDAALQGVGPGQYLWTTPTGHDLIRDSRGTRRPPPLPPLTLDQHHPPTPGSSPNRPSPDHHAPDPDQPREVGAIGLSSTRPNPRCSAVSRASPS